MKEDALSMSMENTEDTIQQCLLSHATKVVGNQRVFLP